MTAKKTWKKNVAELMVAHGVPYVATVCPSYPLDLIRKVEKAKKVKGPSYIHCFTVCPTGWRSASELTVALGRLAVETLIFPLYEVEDGKYRLTVDVDNPRPIEDYLKHQGRFRHLTPDQIRMIQERVYLEYNKLMDKVENLQAWSDLKYDLGLLD